MAIIPFPEKENKEKSKGMYARLRAHRMRNFLLILLGVVIVVIAIFVVRSILKNRVYEEYRVVNSVPRTSSSSSEVVAFGSSFLSYNDDGIRCTLQNGNDIWNYPFEMQNPMVEVNGNYVAVADHNGHNIYMFDSSGNVGTIQTSEPISNITLSAAGVLLAVVDGGEVTPVYLYYYDGTKLASFRSTMAKSGYPLALGVSDDGKLVEVSYLYMDSGSLMSKIAFYNFGKVGQNETDNLVSGYDYKDEIIPVVDFLDNSTAFAVGTGRIMFYEGNERPENRKTIMLNEKVQSVFYGSGYVGLVYNDLDHGNRYRMDLYHGGGKEAGSIPFELEYDDIVFAGDRIIIYNASSCEIYTVSGTLKYQGEFDDSVFLMLPTNSESKYILVTGDSIKTIQLQ